MTTKVERGAAGPTVGRTPISGTIADPSKLVVVWAGLGGVMVAVILCTWLRWITSPDFRATPHGPDRFIEKYYQYPVHSAFLGATVLVSLRALRWFRDDPRLPLSVCNSQTKSE